MGGCACMCVCVYFSSGEEHSLSCLCLENFCMSLLFYTKIFLSISTVVYT